MKTISREVSNAQIAGLFKQVADLLDLDEENQFRIRAYRDAARRVEGLPRPVSAMLAAGEDLEKLPGIGKDLSEKMAEIVHSGRLGLLENLRHGHSAGLAKLLDLPDLGPKRVKVLAELGVKSPSGLRKAARAGRLAGLPGFGKTLQAKILGHMKFGGQAASARISWDRAHAIARPLVRHLKKLPGLLALEVAGSYRRRHATVGDLDILVSAKDPAAAVQRFLAYPDLQEKIAAGPTRAAMRLKGGFQVDMRVVPLEDFGAALLYFTGSKEHNVMLRSKAKAQGLKLNEYGIYKGAKRLGGRTEQEIYKVLGLPWVSPEER